MEFKQEFQTREVHLMLAALEHEEMNRQVEVTWMMLCTISHSIMVHARCSEVYIKFAFMYTPDHIFPVLPIKDMTNEDDDQTMPYKLATGTKPSVSHLHVLFFHVFYRKILHMLGQRR